MKRLFISLMTLLISMQGFAIENQVREHYVIKFYLNSNTTYDLVPSDLYVDISSKVITLYDSGRIVKWQYHSVETVTHNTHFKYDYYHIAKGDTNAKRIVVSRRAEIKNSHDGIFYYRVVIGDKTYLASKSIN